MVLSSLLSCGLAYIIRVIVSFLVVSLLLDSLFLSLKRLYMLSEIIIFLLKLIFGGFLSLVTGLSFTFFSIKR